MCRYRANLQNTCQYIKNHRIENFDYKIMRDSKKLYDNTIYFESPVLYQEWGLLVANWLCMGYFGNEILKLESISEKMDQGSFVLDLFIFFILAWKYRLSGTIQLRPSEIGNGHGQSRWGCVRSAKCDPGHQLLPSQPPTLPQDTHTLSLSLLISAP